MRLAAASALAVCLLPACSSETLQRMDVQEKLLPYSASPLFEDGRAMRTPPPGTVPRERLRFRGLPGGGRDQAGAHLTLVPVRITPELLARGRKRYEIICATCHGLVGDGTSMVARNMALRPPPSLHLFADRPPGFFYEVITDGYGLMPSFANELPPDDRWAVVAYVRALQRSQRASLAEAPSAERARLMGGAP